MKTPVMNEDSIFPRSSESEVLQEISSRVSQTLWFNIHVSISAGFYFKHTHILDVWDACLNVPR